LHWQRIGSNQTHKITKTILEERNTGFGMLGRRKRNFVLLLTRKLNSSLFHFSPGEGPVELLL